MKLSFVIPAYNEEARIASCISSVQKEIARSHADAEIIVVNNASTDRTREIAQGFSGARVVDEPHKGLTHARQAGFNASSGDLIANIDADTLMPKGWIDTVLRAFERDPKLVALSGPYIYYDLSLWQRFWVRLFYIVGFVGYIINRFVLRVGSLLQGGNFVVRRDALEQIGGFDTSIEFHGEDTDAARRLHKVGGVRFTFALPMYSSGRRLAHEGLIRTGITYGTNYLWTTFAKKPWSDTHEDIRTEMHR